MAKRTPPIAGYWVSCYGCQKTVHDANCEYLEVMHTDGTLKNMKYVHHSWGTHWVNLLWTCFPYDELKAGQLQNFSNLQDLKIALGNHRFVGIV
jgi:hypothetical protein